MSKQTVRQAARRAALDAQTRRRHDRAEREARLDAAAVRVLVALGERAAAVTEAETRAAAALREMTEVEGLSLREAVTWCGEGLTLREGQRLRRVAPEPAPQVDSGSTDEGVKDQAPSKAQQERSPATS